jgi:hypothetical protein
MAYTTLLPKLNSNHTPFDIHYHTRTRMELERVFFFFGYETRITIGKKKFFTDNQVIKNNF